MFGDRGHLVRFSSTPQTTVDEALGSGSLTGESMYKLGGKWHVCVVAIFLKMADAAAFGNDDRGTVECQRRTNQPCVAVDYGPYSGVFIVDTGSSCSAAYGSARFHESPDPAWNFRETDGRFSVGSGTVTYIENIPIRAFKGDAQRTRLSLFDKPERSPSHLAIDGILGLPELRERAIRINLPKQLVTEVSSPWQLTDGSANVKLERRSRIDVRVPIKVGSSMETSVIVDTGCGCFMLMQRSNLQFQERLGNAIPAGKVTISTAAAIQEAQTFILRSVTICGFEFRDVEVQEANFNVIGMGCLSHFDMVLDFPYNEMWLTPHSNEWPKRVPPDASGLVLGFQDTNLLSLVRIQPDSPASKSELQVDDQILLFDGKEPKDLSMNEIHERQTQAGTILPLRVRRDDQEFDVQLPLGYSFEYPPKWPNKKNVLDEFGEFLEKDAKSPTSEHAVPNK